MTTQVIFIMSFSPRYEEYGDKPRPAFNWDVPNGKWVGIWGQDWGDILLRALADYSPDYSCEVWRPDLRADKVFSAAFTQNFSHSNFPARMIKRQKLGRIREEIHSHDLLNNVRKHDSPNTVFFLPIPRGTLWMRQVTSAIKQGKILHYNFLNSSIMLPTHYNGRSVIKAVGTFLANRKKSSGLRRVKNLLTMNDNPQALGNLHKLYPSMNLFYFMWGYDLDYWKPVLGKSMARQDFGIPQDKFVFLLSQRLAPEYQVDKVIEALASLNGKYDFICYVTGHGTREYERYLQDVLTRQNLQDKVRFVGFVDDETLRKYFEAADLFINLPVNSAGSASALKASMCGCPVMIVSTGALYEFLNKEDAGIFVDPQDYDSWAHILQKIMDGDIKVRVPSRQALANYFSWEKNINDLKLAIENASIEKK